MKTKEEINIALNELNDEKIKAYKVVEDCRAKEMALLKELESLIDED